VGKFIMITALILLGLFTVYVINNNVAKPSTQNAPQAIIIPTQSLNMAEPKNR
jgi:hypothetical protein